MMSTASVGHPARPAKPRARHADLPSPARHQFRECVKTGQ
jgi:hypothetical protein